MTTYICRAVIIAILCTIPSMATAQSAYPTQEQVGWDKLSGPSPLPESFEFPVGVDPLPNAAECEQCLWNYAEAYSFNAANPPPQSWISYARTCCALCKDNPRAIISLQSVFLGIDHIPEMHGCIMGMLPPR